MVPSKGPKSAESMCYIRYQPVCHGLLSEGLGRKNRDTLSNVGPMALSLGGWARAGNILRHSESQKYHWSPFVKLIEGKHFLLFFCFFFSYRVTACEEFLLLPPHQWGTPCLILIYTADAARAVQKQGLARAPRLLALLHKEGLGPSLF